MWCMFGTEKVNKTKKSNFFFFVCQTFFLITMNFLSKNMSLKRTYRALKGLKSRQFTTKATQSAQYLRYETEYGVSQYLAMHYGQNVHDRGNFTIVQA